MWSKVFTTFGAPAGNRMLWWIIPHQQMPGDRESVGWVSHINQAGVGADPWKVNLQPHQPAATFTPTSVASVWMWTLNTVEGTNPSGISEYLGVRSFLSLLPKLIRIIAERSLSSAWRLYSELTFIVTTDRCKGNNDKDCLGRPQGTNTAAIIHRRVYRWFISIRCSFCKGKKLIIASIIFNMEHNASDSCRKNF